MTEALLAGFRKRSYPPYQTKRNPTIWTSRDDYLEYERALKTAAAFDEIVEPDTKSGNKRTKTPASVAHQFVTPATPGADLLRLSTTPLRTPSLRGSRTPVSAVKKEEDDAMEGLDELNDSDLPENEQRARAVKEAFEDVLYPKWKTFVATAQDRERKAERKAGLERFEPGRYGVVLIVDAHAL